MTSARWATRYQVLSFRLFVFRFQIDLRALPNTQNRKLIIVRHTPVPPATIGLALAVLGANAILVGCGTQTNIDCTSRVDRLLTWLPGYGAAPPDPCGYIPPGASNTLVEIESSPTPAAIYVNGDYIGRTPLKHYLWFSSTIRTVIVVAKPLYPGQGRQEQRLRVPHLPRRLTFFMNNPVKTESDADMSR